MILTMISKVFMILSLVTASAFNLSAWAASSCPSGIKDKSGKPFKVVLMVPEEGKGNPNFSTAEMLNHLCKKKGGKLLLPAGSPDAAKAAGDWIVAIKAEGYEISGFQMLVKKAKEAVKKNKGKNRNCAECLQREEEIARLAQELEKAQNLDALVQQLYEERLKKENEANLDKLVQMLVKQQRLDALMKQLAEESDKRERLDNLVGDLMKKPQEKSEGAPKK